MLMSICLIGFLIDWFRRTMVISPNGRFYKNEVFYLDGSVYGFYYIRNREGIIIQEMMGLVLRDSFL